MNTEPHKLKLEYIGYDNRFIHRWSTVLILASVILVWVLVLLILWMYEGPKRLILRQKFRRNTKIVN